MLIDGGLRLRSRGRRGGGRLVAASHGLVALPTPFGIELRLGKEFASVLGLALGQHLEPIFREQIILYFCLWGTRIELQGILTTFGPTGVEPIEQPLPGLDRQLLLACPDTGIERDAMSNAVAVSDD